MRHPLRALLVPVILVGALSLPACGSDAAKPASAEQASSVVLLDVRAPDEFAAGHLEGAVNLEYESGALEAALGDLDPAATYQVYCRSGRRSALAAALLAEHGFAQVTDLGGFTDAEQATGLSVVMG